MMQAIRNLPIVTAVRLADSISPREGDAAKAIDCESFACVAFVAVASRVFKRFGPLVVLVAALAMSAAMVGTAFAAATTNGVSESSANTIDIEKSILVINANGSTVYKPDITYNYSIAPAAESGAAVTDADGNSAVVKAGVGGGATLADGTAEFSGTQMTEAAATGTSITDTITVSVDAGKFSKAGVYRYAITEEQPSDLTAVGITRPSGYVNTRYLDVYIKIENGIPAVYGYVCFIGNNANSKTSGKTTGFVEQYDTDAASGAALAGNMADRYYTYDFTITKAITGDMAEMTHVFPFVLTTSNAVAGQQFTVAKSGSGSGSITSGVTGDVAKIGTDVAMTLGNGDAITVVGLPANAKFNVIETNDADDACKVAIAGVQAGDNTAEASVAKGKTASVNANEVAVSSYATCDGIDPTMVGNYSAITFTNKFEDISPTGVILRFGPFAFMLAAGVLLLVLSMCRRKKD